MKQAEALEVLKQGHNVFLTGEAGSGKTYLLNQYISYLKERQVSVAVTASTGLAATHINGMTIHKWSGIGIRKHIDEAGLKRLKKKKELVTRINKAKVLVIDEISMLGADQLDLIDRVTKYITNNDMPFGGLQLLLSGDFFQLPPVQKMGEAEVDFAFQAQSWRQGDVRCCYLSEQHRQKDDALSIILNDIRDGEVSERSIELLHSRRGVSAKSVATKIYSHNRDVDALNTAALAKLDGEPSYFEMKTIGSKANIEILKKNALASDELELKVGAEVMFIRNHQADEYINGTRGTVIGFDKSDNWPIVRTTTQKEIVARPAEWVLEDGGKTKAKLIQVPLRLAWAITVHKSQGMTLDEAEINLARSFEAGMGYVALSRLQSLAGLRLRGMNQTALQVSEVVAEHDHQFRKQSRLIERDLSETDDAVKENQVQAFLKRIGAKEKRKAHDGSAEDVATSKDSTSAQQGRIQAMRQQYPQAYKPWTSEDDASLQSMFNNDETIDAMSELLGRQPGAINKRLALHGLIEEVPEHKPSVTNETYQKTRELLRLKLPLDAIVAEREVTRETILNHLTLLKEHYGLDDMVYLRPPQHDIDQVIKATELAEIKTSLKSVKDELPDSFSYFRLKFCLLFIEDE